MTTSKPLISVIMPVYNGGSTIRQAVESVFCQNIPLELLVIDDGSTDQTSEVLSVYQDRPDFHYLKNPHNIGAAASRNRGVQEAHGQYVAFLDADDWWENGKLLLQLDTLHETGRVLCSTGNSPPFRPTTEEEDKLIVDRINELQPDFVWVGLSCPKQERWMHEHLGRVNGLMVGVGAGFDYYAGNISRAPEWMQKHNLEWLYRLIQEPRRLFMKYWNTNFKFIWLAMVKGK